MESEDEFFDAEEEFIFETPLSSGRIERFFTISEGPAKAKASLDFSMISSVKQIELPLTSSHWIGKFSPQGNYFAIAGSSNVILVYPIAPGTLLEAPIYLNEHTYDITSLCWSNRCTLLSGSIDHTVKEWEIRTSCINTFHFHCIVLCCLYLPQDENFFIAAFEDFVVRVVLIGKKEVVQQIQLFENVCCMTVSGSGKSVAVGMNRGRVVVFGVRKNDFRLIDKSLIKARNSRGLKKSGKKVSGLVFFNDEELLVTTLDSNIRLYSLVDCQMKQKYKGADIKVKDNCAHVTYDSEYVISGGDSGKFFIWETVAKETKNRKFETVKVNRHKTPVFIFLAPKSTLTIFSQDQETNTHLYVLFCLDAGNTMSIYLL